MKLRQFFTFSVFTFLFLQFSASFSFSQQRVISGSIKTQDNQPISFARILLYQLPDSLSVNGVVSNEDGKFFIETSDTGRFYIVVQFTGFHSVQKSFTVSDYFVELGTIVLYDNSKELGVVDVTVDSPIGVQKGDTSEYSANSYKVTDDASAEDLVKKIPGISVQDGKVQSQGENVTEVLVDGKPFFGSDPSAVLRNIPAEMIDKVQVYDRKSDQATATGIDDGTTTKSINIITKSEYKEGTFGRIYAGYGDQEKFQSGFSINNFKNDRRVSIVGQANNINQQNFSNDDLSGIASSSSGGDNRRGGNSFGGMMNTSNFLVSQRDGVSSTYASGINYVDKWGKKVSFTGSYFFNLTDNYRFTNLDRAYISTGDFATTYLENSTAQGETFTHRFNLRFDVKLDTSNTIDFRPQIFIQQHTGNTSLNGYNYSDSFLTNQVTTLFSTQFGATNFSAPLTYTHRFKKPKRLISLSVQPQLNINNGRSFLNSETFTNNFISDSVDQLSTLYQNGIFISSNLTYTEPLSKKTQFVFTLNHELSNGDAKKNTFRESGGDYTITDTLLSNTYQLVYQAIKPSVGLKYQKDNLTVNTDLGYQYASLNGNQEFPYPISIDRSFQSILPSIHLSYRKDRKKNLRLSYRTRTQAPDITDLQDVVDNSNPVRLKSGNLNLKQEYFHQLFMRYSSTNSTKNSNFQFSLSGFLSNNYISNHSIIAFQDTLVNGFNLSPGMQYQSPVNLSGYFNLRGFTSYGVFIPKIKCNLILGASASGTNRPSLINGKKNESFSTSFRGNIGLTSNISEKIDFSIHTSGSYTVQFNTLQPERNTNFYNHSSTFKIISHPYKGIILEADATHQYFGGLSDAVTNNYITLNAAIGYKFFKKKNGHLKLSVYDAFNQNNNISRSINDTYFEDRESNALQRYYMVNFIYKFNYFGSKKKTE